MYSPERALSIRQTILFTGFLTDIVLPLKSVTEITALSPGIPWTYHGKANKTIITVAKRIKVLLFNIALPMNELSPLLVSLKYHLIVSKRKPKSHI